MIYWIAENASSGNQLVDWIVQAGPVGILVIVLGLIVRGDLVPRKQVEEMRRAADEQAARLDRALDLVYEQAGLARHAVGLSSERLTLEQERLALDTRLAELRAAELREGS